MNTAPSRQRFRKHHRIRHAADFRRVYGRRRRVSDEWLLLYGDHNHLDHPRLGLSVSRRVGGAVVRNRWKRLLREAFRLNLATLPAGLDLVVIPRPGRRPKLSELSRSLTKLAARLHKKLHSD